MTTKRKYWTGARKAPAQDKFFIEALDPDLWAPAELRARYEGKLHRVDAGHDDALAQVFTGAYGVSPVYSGSWLDTPDGPRRFSAQEILRLMGFPDGMQLVAPSRKKAYKLVGNSLSVDAVASLLEAVR